MIQFIRQNQTALIHQSREDGSIRHESHRKHERIILAHESRDLLLYFNM